MSLFISASKEHDFDVPPPVVGWITTFLWDRLDDPVDQEDLRSGEQIGLIELDALSERARSQLRHALAEELLPAAEAEVLGPGGIAHDRADCVRSALTELSAVAGQSGVSPLPLPCCVPRVVLSEDYDWLMPFGGFDAVARLLRDRLGDAVGAAGEDNLLDLRRLSALRQASARQILVEEAQRAAAAGLPSMVVGTPGHHGGYWDYGRALNEVRALALITREVQREEGTSAAVANRTGCSWSVPPSRSPSTRRVILAEDYLWTAEADEYRWLVRLLCAQPNAPAAVGKFADAPWLDLRSAFSDSARRWVLQRLASDLAEASRASFQPARGIGADRARFAAGRLRTLALLAADVIQRQGAGRRGPGEGRPRDELPSA